MTIDKNLPMVVTGAASGIGAATCRLLTESGHRLIGVDRTVATSFPGTFIQADLATPEGARTAAARVHDAAPEGISGLANIAGVPGTAPWRTVLGVNVVGLREITRTLMPLITESGVIINLSSVVADGWQRNIDALRQFALADDPEAALDTIASGEEAIDDSYRFSKECVRLLTEHFAAEGLPRRIRVNSVSPGPVATPILDDFKRDHGADKVEGAGELLGRFGESEDIARVLVFLTRDEARWVNGTDLRVDGGLTAYRNTRTNPATEPSTDGNQGVALQQ
ncbi:SDR family oxidoreductase [Haloactinomyces albus]|uniref:NAD(P)-dependent dehydrogenase (Short-subunit alcohol dehydrogenase family) n=1 Tax=Haloactinomyces albus TaxID=1352928 RepID=A0AAE3ZI20_9ACTN|nr:SDR family oxidoreductase [Haloactinomyces albus]MDR7303994.1 NAD(P)-dependent dehydrogenase (short-subunit alcohol dehydrogenase family) [Haloactinomyces albus]